MIGGQGETFSALISAKNSGGGGPLDVDFDNAWQLLTYSNAFGTGAFEFSVTNDLDLTKNTSGSIFGGIRNATFTPDMTVPEPATLRCLASVSQPPRIVGAASSRRQPGPWFGQ